MRPAPKWLLLPTLPPLALYASLEISLAVCDPNSQQIIGAQQITGGILMALILTGGVVAAWEVIAVLIAAPQLVRDRSSRTWRNLAAIGVACIYIAATGFYFPHVVHIE